MGMGGFILQIDGHQTFPIILGAEFKDKSGKKCKMMTDHFMLKNLYENNLKTE